MLRPAAALLAVSLTLTPVLASKARADEGMWTFDNFPAARVNQTYGTRIDQAWLDRVRNASVRLTTGCSASLVSPEGLVLTNHHCIVGCAQDLSSAQTDYVAKGFLTRARTEEKQCPGMQAEILTSIADVTERVTGAGAGKSGQDFVRARDAETARIEAEGCGTDASVRCQVVSLYRGGQYKLYKYRKYADVRLAFAPEFQAAFFGGDPDNFSFPRYALDSAFVRLYENGRPIASPAYLPWNAEAPKENEPVFVSGNPGSTNRLQTVSQLQTLRDLVIPHQQLQRSELRGRLIRFSQESPENKRIATDPLFGVENSYKNYYGRMRFLADPAFFEGKRRAEAEVHALDPRRADPDL
ncbi:MAG: S46 family peptidase, partial [Proteobacteria bacterium]|nr:S46 family peptidase [Pseudomonadota bacterium]